MRKATGRLLGVGETQVPCQVPGIVGVEQGRSVHLRTARDCALARRDMEQVRVQRPELRWVL